MAEHGTFENEVVFGIAADAGKAPIKVIRTAVCDSSVICLRTSCGARPNFLLMMSKTSSSISGHRRIVSVASAPSIARRECRRIPGLTPKHSSRRQSSLSSGPALRSTSSTRRSTSSGRTRCDPERHLQRWIHQVWRGCVRRGRRGRLRGRARRWCGSLWRRGVRLVRRGREES